MYRAGIITSSDKSSQGQREDKSGEVIKEILKREGYEIADHLILADEQDLLSSAMVKMSDDLGMDLIITTGGTGFSPRDVTPEATRSIITKEAMGIANAINFYSLSITKRAMLSRGVSGIRNQTLIINLPGSPKAVRECLEYIIDSVKHGLDILKGNDGECART